MKMNIKMCGLDCPRAARPGFPLPIVAAAIATLRTMGEHKEAMMALVEFFDDVESRTAYTLAMKRMPVCSIPSKAN